MKIRRKLLSAGLAFGATALTLTTSTFAWYTGNTEIEVAKITGATETTMDTASIYVATPISYAQASTYTPATDITSENFASKKASLFADDSGTPLDSEASYNSDTTYYYQSTSFNPVTSRVNEIGNYTTSATPLRLGGDGYLVPVAFNDGNYKTMTVTNKGSRTNYVTETIDTNTEGDWESKVEAGLYTSSGTEPNITYSQVPTTASYDSDTTYYKANGTTRNEDTVNYSQAAATNVYSYVLRFRTAAANIEGQKVYLSKFDLTNAATKEVSQQNALADDNTLGTDAAAASKVGIASAGSYNVDLLHALKMTVFITNLASDGSYPESPTTTSTTYDLDGYADVTKDANIRKVNSKNDANAVGYYNEVLGTNIVRPNNYLTATGVKNLADNAEAAAADQTLSNLFTISNSGYVEVRFVFWLDGWDDYCYDVCRKQGFSVAMNFSTNPADSIWTANAAENIAQ